MCDLVKVIASGSKGNSTYIESNGTKILIDVGINYILIKESLKEIDRDINDLDGIFISHAHHDHISGLEQLHKKVKAPVFIRKYLENTVRKIVSDDYINIIDTNEKINIGSFEIEVFNNSHDVPNSGYVITGKENSFVYITDTGYVNKKNIEKTINKNVYIIESNHDEEMLMNGPYPPFLKQRVISDKGHLSNRATSEYLKELVGKDTKYILLAHLSEKNNTEELAFNSSKKVLKNKRVELMIARQDEESSLIEV